MKKLAKRRLTLSIAGLALALGLLVPAGASAASSIEGVWSFNGGEVAVQAQPDGSFTGTVVAPTKFSLCYHSTGEEMWTKLTLQPDGSYFGYHQWFFDDDCSPNPTLGLTAFRVLEKEGARYLRVCFSRPSTPSEPATQPTIAPDGTSANANFGCSDSALVSALTPVTQAEASKYIQIPPATSCISRKKLRVKIIDPIADPFASIEASLRSGKTIRKGKVVDGNGRSTATFSLLGLTAPRFVVRVKATTVLGKTLRAKRRYRICKVPGKGHRRIHPKA